MPEAVGFSQPREGYRCQQTHPKMFAPKKFPFSATGWRKRAAENIDGRPWRREPEAELSSVEYGQAFVAEGRTIIDFK